MLKIKKVLVIFLIILCIPINIFALEIDDDYEELDYVWLEEEIENAKNDEELAINSRYAVIFDRTSKTAIWGKNENMEVPMASTTKIMTAIVMLENISNLNEKSIVCKQAAGIGGSRLGLKTGDEITYSDLLYGLMLCSGNDCAIQIAVSIAGSVEEFANLMNKKANELGLEHSKFVTPHGLDNEGHYTTALELAIIADYALSIEKIQEVVSTKTYTVNINGYPKTINNTNELLGYLNGVNGVKTGFTNGAGRCLVTSVIRENFNIITVVLGADTKKIRTKDSIKLIEYAYSKYELIDIREIVEESFNNWKQINNKRIEVYKGQQRNVDLILGKLKYEKYPVLKSEKENIYVDISSIFKIEAPIEKNKKIGEIKIFLNSTEIMDVDILTDKKIERKTWLNYLRELLIICKLLFVGVRILLQKM